MIARTPVRMNVRIQSTFLITTLAPGTVVSYKARVLITAVVIILYLVIYTGGSTFCWSYESSIVDKIVPTTVVFIDKIKTTSHHQPCGGGFTFSLKRNFTFSYSKKLNCFFRSDLLFHPQAFLCLDSASRFVFVFLPCTECFFLCLPITRSLPITHNHSSSSSSACRGLQRSQCWG